MSNMIANVFGKGYLCFDDLFDTGIFDETNIYRWEQDVLHIYRIIGYTQLPGDDYLLHVIQIDEQEDDALSRSELIKKYQSVSFITLNQLIGDSGFALAPRSVPVPIMEDK